jgi:hypothetical protein
MSLPVKLLFAGAMLIHLAPVLFLLAMLAMITAMLSLARPA